MTVSKNKDQSKTKRKSRSKKPLPATLEPVAYDTFTGKPMPEWGSSVVFMPIAPETVNCDVCGEPVGLAPMAEPGDVSLHGTCVEAWDARELRRRVREKRRAIYDDMRAAFRHCRSYDGCVDPEIYCEITERYRMARAEIDAGRV